ncbi:hypothetical protein V865_000214 [Kwoniella europaea PYCC6329]|uniref:F-box domain-containing protein n=1 Tax=Kwoniella europaea PYCC6329 TaxID=1423913 RepID=A0AAX4K6Y7_9TREE
MDPEQPPEPAHLTVRTIDSALHTPLVRRGSESDLTDHTRVRIPSAVRVGRRRSAPYLPSELSERPIEFASNTEEFFAQCHISDVRVMSTPDLPSCTLHFTNFIYRPLSSITAYEPPIRSWYKNPRDRNKWIVDEPPKRKFNQLPSHFMEWIYTYLPIHQDRVNFAQTSSKPMQAYFKIRCHKYGFGRPLLEVTKKTWIEVWDEVRNHWKTCDVPYCTNAGRNLGDMPFSPPISVETSLVPSGEATPWSTDTGVSDSPNTSPSQLDAASIDSHQRITANPLIEYYIQSEGQVGPDKFLGCRFRKSRKRISLKEIKDRISDFLHRRPHHYTPPPETLHDHPSLAYALLNDPPQLSLVVKVNIVSGNWGEIRYGYYVLHNADGITLLDAMHSLQLSMNQNIKRFQKIPMYQNMLVEDEYKAVRDTSAYLRMKRLFNRKIQQFALRTRPRSVNNDVSYLGYSDEQLKADLSGRYRDWAEFEIWFAAQPVPAPFIDKFSNWSGRVRKKNLAPWNQLHLMPGSALQVLSNSALPDFVLQQTNLPKVSESPWDAIDLPPIPEPGFLPKEGPIYESPQEITPPPEDSGSPIPHSMPITPERRDYRSPPGHNIDSRYLVSPNETEESELLQTPPHPSGSSSSPRQISSAVQRGQEGHEGQEEEEEPVTTGYASSGRTYSPPQKPEGYVAVPTPRRRVPLNPIQELSASGGAASSGGGTLQLGAGQDVGVAPSSSIQQSGGAIQPSARSQTSSRSGSPSNDQSGPSSQPGNQNMP